MPAASQLHDSELRLRIQKHIESGKLPCFIPRSRISAGYGGNACVGCDQPIAKKHIEYEVRDDRAGRQLNFHFGCYVLWQIECTSAAHARDQVSQHLALQLPRATVVTSALHSERRAAR